MEAAENNVTIYTDGACLGNPGSGGYGVVLICGASRKEISGGYAKTTNNRMELMAAIVALEALKRRCTVKLHTDSKYLQLGVENGWAKKWRVQNWRKGNGKRLNWELWSRLLDLCDRHDVKFLWVRGHANVVENERCDALASQAALQENLPEDEGFVSKPTHPSLFNL